MLLCQTNPLHVLFYYIHAPPLCDHTAGKEYEYLADFLSDVIANKF